MTEVKAAPAKGPTPLIISGALALLGLLSCLCGAIIFLAPGGGLSGSGIYPTPGPINSQADPYAYSSLFSGIQFEQPSVSFESYGSNPEAYSCTTERVCSESCGYTPEGIFGCVEDSCYYECR